MKTSTKSNITNNDYRIIGNMCVCVLVCTLYWDISQWDKDTTLKPLTSSSRAPNKYETLQMARYDLSVAAPLPVVEP